MMAVGTGTGQFQIPSPFFIWFTGRSGSTHLVSLLASHSGIRCEMEVFEIHAETRGRLRSFQDSAVTREYLERLYNSPKVKAAGFKFKDKQKSVYPDVWEFLREHSCSIRVLCLHRRNHLKRAISSQNLRRIEKVYGIANVPHRQLRYGDRLKRIFHRLKFGVEPPLDQLNAGKIVLDIPRALRYMKRIEKEAEEFFQAAEEFPHRHYLTYEDLLVDESDTMREVLQFLGVDWTIPLKSSFHKITSDNIEDAVANYEELRLALTGTGYEGFLEG